MDIRGGAKKLLDLKNRERKFRFLSASAAVESGRAPDIAGETTVVLVPFRTLAAYPFSFPFGRKGRIRDALAFKFRPVLGAQEEALSLVPQITEQKANLTKGIAWMISKTEISEWEQRLGSDVVFWPAPVAFAQDVGGSGLVIWSDADGSSAALFEEREPIFYRWQPASKGDAEELAEWMSKYAESTGRKIGAIKMFTAETVTHRKIEESGEAALNFMEGLDIFDLSTSGANMAEQIEAFFSAAFKGVKILSILGIIFTVLTSVLLVQNIERRSSFNSAPSRAYAAAFKEQSSSPLTSALRKQRMLAGSGAQMSILHTLNNFTAAWNSASLPPDTKIDAIRYGAERTEIQGLADDMNDIQKLRDALAQNGFTAKVDEVQQVPGSGLRFSLSLTGAGQ